MAQYEQHVLRERLSRFPVDRYPVQHATAQFHLGSVLLHAGEPVPAGEALAVAQGVFTRTGMALESAKATVMLGIALRAAGRLDEASAAFTAAGADFAALGQDAEQAAASYNLGLVCQDRGDAADANLAWTMARDLFLAAGYPAQAAAAARDHGGSLILMGKIDAAVSVLTDAGALSQRADDLSGQGAAANALGLAHLAADDPVSAIAALRSALGFFPRSVRPDDQAMVKANLALAYEQAGEPARARLAAGQAVAVTSAEASVRQQARQVLCRLPGLAHTALLGVLDDEPLEHWAPVVREELLRLTESPATERDREVRGLLDGLLARPAACYDLAENLLSVLLELPPGSYLPLVQALAHGTGGRPPQETERLRAILGSAMARFAMPQWQRLAAHLNAAAEQAGQPTTWG